MSWRDEQDFIFNVFTLYAIDMEGLEKVRAAHYNNLIKTLQNEVTLIEDDEERECIYNDILDTYKVYVSNYEDADKEKYELFKKELRRIGLKEEMNL